MAAPTHGGKHVGTKHHPNTMVGQGRQRWRHSRILFSLLALFVGATRTSFAHGLLLSMAATTEKIPIRPVWFSSQGCSHDPPPSSNLQNQSPLVIFIHGRLEAEEDEPPFDAPSKLYQDFCRGLAEAMQPQEETQPEPSVLLLEYDELLSKELPREPRNFSYGPVSTALAEAISTHVLVPRKAGTKDQQQQQPKQQIVLVSFSMGAAMALKLLKNSNALTKALTHVVLIEPVWRCWLPFCVSSPSPILSASTGDEYKQEESGSPRVLALYGTHDDQTQVDSGGSVRGSLRPFLPDLETIPLEGGNHWGILSESVAGDIAREGLAADSVAETITMSPQLLQTKMITAIASFCGWDSRE